MSETSLKGPAFFTAQFFDPSNPDYDSLRSLCRTAKANGYSGVSPHMWGDQLFDLAKAAGSKDYCDAEIHGVAHEASILIAEPSNHCETQLVAVGRATRFLFDGMAPEELRKNPKEQSEWAVKRAKLSVQAASNMGFNCFGAFSGELAWAFMYPWPQRPPGLIEAAFVELANRWRPVFELACQLGVKVCFELHPGEDLHDGATFNRFLDQFDGEDCLDYIGILFDPSHFVLQQLDYIEFVQEFLYRIHMQHVKDAVFDNTTTSGVYGGYLPWSERPGRFESPGDGEVDFVTIFDAFKDEDKDFWATMEWESIAKGKAQGLREGAPFIEALLNGTDLPQNGHPEPHSDVFDAFAGQPIDKNTLSLTLGFEVTNEHLVGVET